MLNNMHGSYFNITMSTCMTIYYNIAETFFDDLLFTLEELKNYLRVSCDYDDQLIINLSRTAIADAENTIGISLHSKKIIANIICSKNIQKLRYPKIKEIISVQVITQGKKIDITNSYGFFESTSNQLYLNAEYKDQNIEVEYISSYGNKEIPYPIKQGVLMHIALMYELSENNLQMNTQIKDLYLPYRILKI
ncbi:MAG: phage gp6-like head-tail connector protein [Rickettsiales bacterium]|nr:MAG: phage gp6-like head-tail connector protein [Rickettsiales bacterium]